MKKRVKITTSNRSAIVGIVPIMVGVLVFVWSLWFFGFEQVVSKRISNYENTQGLQSIIIHRAAQKYHELRKKINPDTGKRYTHDEAQDKVNSEVIAPLMKKNGL